MHEPEHILRVERDIAWLPKPNECQVVLASHLPQPHLVSTALVIAFMDDQLLMTNLTHRGWDIPGGHVESGETPEETVRREVYEETYATLGPLHLLGYQRLRLLGPRPTPYNYPYPVCYQAFYWAHIASLDDFLPTAEAQARALFPPIEAQNLAFVQHLKDLYEAARLLASR